MTYHLKPKRQKKYTGLIIAGILGFVVLLVYVFFPATFSSVFAWIGIPILRGEQQIAEQLSGVVNITHSKESILKENEMLRGEIDAARYALLQAQLLQKENQELKQLLGRETQSKNFILAAVLARPPQTAYDSLIVDVGSELGIAVGNRVIVQGNIPIGMVAAVEKHFSKIVLYSSAGQQFDVVIGTSTHAKAEALGGDNFRIKLPKETPVKEGDIIALPSIDARFFGAVGKIDATEGDAFKQVLFSNPVTLARLRFVEIDTSETEIPYE